MKVWVEKYISNATIHLFIIGKGSELSVPFREKLIWFIDAYKNQKQLFLLIFTLPIKVYLKTLFSYEFYVYDGSGYRLVSYING